MKKILIFIVFLYATRLNAASVVGLLIASNTLVEQNERNINDIFFATIAKHNFTFTEAQKEEVANIAYQCPYTGGEAVYRARVLHTALTGLTDFNDSTACSVQGINWRYGNTQATESSLHLAVIPNPVSSEAQFVLEKATENNTFIKVYSSIGQIVIECSIPANESRIRFSTEKLSAGIYHYTGQSGSQFLYGKFIVENK